jgi:(2Fe-2S) ferredoxin
VLIYPEGVMYGRVQKADVAEIFERHLQQGKPVERLLMAEEFWG